MPQPVDPLLAIKQYLNAGGSIKKLSQLSGVTEQVIQTWINKGLPEQVINWNKTALPTQVMEFRTVRTAAYMLHLNRSLE